MPFSLVRIARVTDTVIVLFVLLCSTVFESLIGQAANNPSLSVCSNTTEVVLPNETTLKRPDQMCSLGQEAALNTDKKKMKTRGISKDQTR